MKTKLIFILTLLPVIAQCGGSNWFLMKNGYSLEIGHQYIKTSKYFDNDGEKQDFLDYSTNITFLQTQYALSDKFNMGLYFPAIIYSSAEFQFNDTTNETRSASSTGDMELFGKYCFYKTPKSTFIVTGKIILPTGTDDNDYRLNTGFGSFGEAAMIEYIYKHNEKLYMQAYGGFLNRENNFTDEVIAGGDIGYHILPELWTVFLCRAINPLENGNDGKPGGLPGLAANNSGYVRLGLQLAIGISKKIDLYAKAFYPVRGQFVQAAPVYEAGISILFNKKTETE